MQIGGQQLRAGDYGRQKTADWFISTHFGEMLDISMDTILRSQANVITVSEFGWFNFIIIFSVGGNALQVTQVT